MTSSKPSRVRHTREHGQLDLFIDSAQTAAVSALVDALTDRHASEARGALERLARIDRDHGQRFHASTLISALEAPTPAEPAQGLELLERMEREWVPAAATLLGTRRRDFLAPLWRDIGRALDPAPFDPRQSRTPCIQSVPRGARLTVKHVGKKQGEEDVGTPLEPVGGLISPLVPEVRKWTQLRGRSCRCPGGSHRSPTPR